MSNVLAILPASLPRRAIALVATSALGLFLIWIALSQPPATFGWRLFLLGAGGLILWLADAMRRATARRLELTRDELRDDQGRVLTRVADIRKVDRGTFALKPSSGFRLVLTRSAPIAWAPGLWWRLGRNIGVGGMTTSAEGKYMAEVIAMMISEAEPDA